jgi:hypothetical protein
MTEVSARRFAGHGRREVVVAPIAVISLTGVLGAISLTQLGQLNGRVAQKTLGCRRSGLGDRCGDLGVPRHELQHKSTDAAARIGRRGDG